MLGDIHDIEDFRRAARRRLPRMVYDLIEGGSQTESTIRENEAALERIRLVPSGPADISRRRASVTLFGAPAALPLVVGPTALASLFWPGGDLVLAAAAARAGVPFVMSHHANVSPEAVAAASGDGRRWFQLFMGPDRDGTVRLLDRIRAAGFELLEVTVDTPVGSRRLRDMRNGMSSAFRWSPRKLLDVACHPRWLLRAAWRRASKRGRGEAEKLEVEIDPALSWDDLAWLRDHWTGLLVVKGISDPLQAEEAVRRGYDGIVVSNHGGRQLDGAVAAIEMLPEIAAVARPRLTLLVDGGFRTGPDILKALALGASAVQLGRATLYGLATAGGDGVAHVLGLLAAEIDIAQALCGVTDLASLTPAWVRRRG